MGKLDDKAYAVFADTFSVQSIKSVGCGRNLEAATPFALSHDLSDRSLNEQIS